MMLFRRRRQRTSPRIKLLELAVATRYAVSRLGLLAARLKASYERTGDASLHQMLRNVLRLQAVLEVLSIRLETLANIGAISSEDLSIVKKTLLEAKQAYGIIAPGIASMLADLENMVSSIASMSGVEVSVTEDPVVNEHVKKILEEAEAVAEQRLTEIIEKPA
ncbi:hypothetical protein Pyrde_1120 [Pyrodictium delaneyi]|uniref:Uncharacterized protein n=2 Tax=Pyrodictium delaneyi TaxID=1273541 RepID=A0A0P0N428_9CREN|nr:hypothetical protein [Pyrodictium delaneyi]ALL01168.1 hypothetical protein Pyrde_1120 [Pyrodictium delaneyi]